MYNRPSTGILFGNVDGRRVERVTRRDLGHFPSELHTEMSAVSRRLRLYLRFPYKLSSSSP